MQITRQLGRVALASLALAGSATGAVLANSAANASSKSPAPAAAPPSGSVRAGALAAIEGLVSDGTLTRAQGDAIEAQIRAGSIDPKQLVDAGVLTDAKMRIAATAIDQVKRNNG